MTRIWKRKPGPVWSWSRLMHFVLAFGIAGYGAYLWGNVGCAYGAGLAVLGGLAWEIANRWIPGEHQWADLWDFVAFVLGGAAAAVGWGVFGHP